MLAASLESTENPKGSVDFFPVTSLSVLEPATLIEKLVDEKICNSNNTNYNNND